MPVQIKCPGCAAVLQIPDNLLGRSVKCSKCQNQFTAQAPETPAGLPASSWPARPSGLGGLFLGLRGLFSGWTGAAKPEGAKGKPATPIPEELPLAGEHLEEVSLELDGPTAPPAEKTEESAAAPVLMAEPEALHGQFRLDIAGATSTGRVRQRNEDSFLVQQLSWSNRDTRHDAAGIVVADGMGGYEAGDRASHLIIRVLGAFLAGLWRELLNPEHLEVTPPALAKTLDEAVRSANTLVYQQAQNPGCKGMGATLAALTIWNGQVHISHVGDCRVYHLHEGNLQQVTRDQTLVARMLELGQLTEEEARTHVLRNEVTQAIGRRPEIQPAAYEVKLTTGDWLIIACDGLHAHVDAPLLREVLLSAPPSSKGVAQHLVDLANHHGGTDNCTVVAVRCF